ncbi:MAG: type II toxin-antitoxin system ParD family antitoxin [Odoribacter sp.]|nr:type II toxin-antitoxin system ParD family antitoxin [Odoribacter sp.]
MKTTSVALGTYFENFIKAKISQGRYNNASEVIRAGLRLLEENEEQIMALKAAIDEGFKSGVAENFDPREHLKVLKATRTNG